MHVDLSQRAPHQVAHAEALTEGLKRHGVLGEFRNVVACWGWRSGARHYRAGRDVLVLERGYIGDRFAWTSIGWNGLNGRATFPNYPDDGGARFRRVRGPMERWRAGGDCVLLIGQVHGDAALQGRNLGGWYADTARAAADVYGLPVLFRPHPLEVRRIGVVRTVAGTEQDTGPLEVALSRAAVVVTWNSNTGVDALLAGKLTVAHDAGAMAWPVCGHRLGDPGSGDREAWAHALAWKQWSMDEIRSGEALVGIVEDVRNGRYGQGRRLGGDRSQAPAAA
jgi:hypothetical protein